METILPVEDGDTLKALQGFLRCLLESGDVEAILAPLRTRAGTISPALVTDPLLLDQADPLAPVLPVNGAILAGRLSAREPRPKVGVVLRACELRALVELVKLQQASLEHLTLIALDCAGTYSLRVYQRRSAEAPGEGLWRDLYQAAAERPEAPEPELRLACQVCEQPVFEGAPISIHLLDGVEGPGLQISLPDELGTRLGYSPAAPVERGLRLERLVAARTARRDAELAAMQSRLSGDGLPQGEGMGQVFAACIRCHNCMTVCPICYCKTCVFRSAIYDHDPAQYLAWAKQKGACRMPSDTVLFHLTRLNHMALSCVGCGMCTEACPSEIPVGLVFKAIGGQVQAVFNYTPGRSLDDPLPMVTFKADEWTEVGE
ncbi:MAG TPA: 4Fe-4S dicluster domain-containing protein [Anaerolineales bacterium]